MSGITERSSDDYTNSRFWVPWGFHRVCGGGRERAPGDRLQTETAIKARILDTSGVARLIFFNMVFDGQSRELTVSFRGETEFGGTFGFNNLTI